MMKKLLLFLIFLLLPFLNSAQNIKNVTFLYKDSSLVNTQQNIYLSGNFNNWNPTDSTYKMSYTSNHFYSLIKALQQGNYEFKLTNGSWESVETNNAGNDVKNRNFKLLSDTSIYIEKTFFRNQFAQTPVLSTASKQVHIVSDNFKMTKLNRQRRIWIYLPQSYLSSKKKYPVIYMQDGQNLFDKSTSGFGEWGVDEVLDSLQKTKTKDFIVIGIEHGGDERLSEYNPFETSWHLKGEGDDYLNFLVNELMPFVNKHYRISTQKKNTTIAGSSMGALISLYAILKYPDIFGKAGIFSPALWIAPDMYKAAEKAKTTSQKLYFVAGDAESKEMLPDMYRMYAILKDKQSADIKTIKNGKHNEAFWHQQFADFIAWLSR